MDSDLTQKAIAAALAGNWKEAVILNKKILKTFPDDCETLNRLAKACFELGKIKEAKEICQKVLKIDPFNRISQRNLAKWKNIKSKDKISCPSVTGGDFIEEPGKTKLLTLVHPGDAKVLAELNAGDEVQLSPHAHRVSVISLDKKYIGRLPDDLSARLRRFIKLGNSYRTWIKSVEGRYVKIFIKEVARGKAVGEASSFPTEKTNYNPSTPLKISRKLTA